MKLNALIATFFGLGLLPKAPGTWGSLGAVPVGLLIYYFAGISGSLIAIVIVSFVGTWVADEYDKRSGTHDNKSIVIDEVAGQWIALLPAGLNPLLIVLSFLLFRLFDITKPPPCRRLEKFPGGAGVMADDIMAGIYALICVMVLRHADLVEQLAKLLEQKNMQLAVAESCTGGLLAATITHRPGTSKIFDRGFVTYTNESKMEMLGVPKEIIDNHGAVSMECAQAMAQGALKNSHANLTVSITGIAGPDGGMETKPVGLVYFGYALKGGSAGSIEHRFSGDRAEIQTHAVITALRHMISVLDKGHA